MTFPEHLHPLPTVIQNPRAYVTAITFCRNTEAYCYLCSALMLELGLTEKFYKVLDHITRDIIEVFKGRKQTLGWLLKKEMLRWNKNSETLEF